MAPERVQEQWKSSGSVPDRPAPPLPLWIWLVALGALGAAILALLTAL
ncbi:MAG TPA: hypothetical protein VMX33_07200 [bacterium]|nr:hypothetical protein [bacterium]